MRSGRHWLSILLSTFLIGCGSRTEKVGDSSQSETSKQGPAESAYEKSPIKVDLVTSEARPRRSAQMNRPPRRWAVIVGINDYQKVAQLDYCGNDAYALQQVLCEFGGYNSDEVLLLTDVRLADRDAAAVRSKRPTRDVILGSLQSVVRNAQDDDTILFAFAGHGMADGDRGYLIPIDGDPNRLEASAVPMSRVYSLLGQCAATSIMIIDACHSGGTRGSTVSDAGFNQRLLTNSAQGVYGLFSCDSDQKSFEDRNLRHGVFSYYLLEGLKGHADLDFNKAISVDELHAYVTRHVPHHLTATLKLNRKQTPFRIVAGTGQAPIISEYTRIPLNAEHLDFYTLTGLYGKSWFEEAPWLLPCLRPELTRQMPEQLLSANVEQVYDTLRTQFNQYVDQLSDADQHDFLRMLLYWDYNTTAPELKERVLQTVQSLSDAHTSAVFYAHFEMEAEANEAFKQARQHYVRQTVKGPHGLLALCESDYALFLSKTGNQSSAIEAFRSARRRIGDSTVAPLFHIYCLCSEANVHRKLAHWRDTRSCLMEAESIATGNLPQNHPIVAHVQQRLAWQYMDQWRVEEARTAFEKSLVVWDSLIDTIPQDQRLRVLVSRFHDQHGLAMIDRYTGKLDKAIERYSQLRDSVEAERDEHADDPAASRSLNARLVNTKERLADCYLLAANPEPRKANRVYGEALAEIDEQVDPTPWSTTKAKLGYKMALAHAFDGRYALSQARLDQLPLSSVDPPDDLTTFYREAAQTVLQLREGDQRRAFQDLRKLISSRTQTDHVGKLNRDKLDLLLLLCIPMMQRDLPSDDMELAAFWTDVRSFFRLIPNRFRRGEVLPYLRRYYDRALAMCMPRLREHALLSFLDYVAIAKTGRPVRGLESHAVLMFYFPYNNSTDAMVKGMALLHHPDGTSHLYDLSVARVDLIRSASDGRPIPLPDGLHRFGDLSAPLRVHWEDLAWQFENSTFPYQVASEYQLIDRR